MGWFSNPDCPRCGQEQSIGTDGLTNYYTCRPCNLKAIKENKEKDALLKRVAILEEKLKEK